MKDPRAKTLEGMIVACEIFAKYAEKGMRNEFSSAAEHDILYGCCSTIIIPEDSEDGQKLRELGWHDSEGMWAYFT